MTTPNMYELYENERMVGIYKCSEIEEILDISKSRVFNCASTGYLIAGKYRIRKSDITYKEAKELRKMLPDYEVIKKKETPDVVMKSSTRKSFVLPGYDSSGKTFVLPEWDKDGNIKNISKKR